MAGVGGSRLTELRRDGQLQQKLPLTENDVVKDDKPVLPAVLGWGDICADQSDQLWSSRKTAVANDDVNDVRMRIYSVFEKMIAYPF